MTGRWVIRPCHQAGPWSYDVLLKTQRDHFRRWVNAYQDLDRPEGIDISGLEGDNREEEEGLSIEGELASPEAKE